MVSVIRRAVSAGWKECELFVLVLFIVFFPVLIYRILLLFCQQSILATAATTQASTLP